MIRKPLTHQEKAFIRNRRRIQRARKLMTIGYAFMAGWMSCQIIVLVLLDLL